MFRMIDGAIFGLFMRRMFLYFIGIFLSSNVMAQPVDLATIGGEKIGIKDFWEYVGKRIDLKGQVTNVYAVEKIIDEMMLTRSLELEGERLGINSPGNENKDERFNDLKGDAIYKKIVTPCVRLKKEDEREYYNNNKENFRSPEMIRLYRVMLPVAGVYGGEPAKKLIETWAEDIKNGKEDILGIASKAAKIHVQNPQGDLGWLSIDGDDEVVNYLKSTKTNEIAGPYESNGYVYLFLIADRRNSEVLEYALVAPEVGRKAFALCSGKQRGDLKSKLYNFYHGSVYRDHLHLVFDQKEKPNSN